MGLLLSAFLVSPMQGAPTPTGTVITGLVANEATREFLDCAEVAVEGTALKVLTNHDGSYRLAGLAPGSYTLVATYAGLDASRPAPHPR
jgi:iron complex outermembrane receptor protein